MRSAIWIIIVLAVFLVGIFVIRLSTDEDSWICTNGQWTRHGNPAFDIPTVKCDETGSKQINFIKYGYLSDREADQPNSGIYLIYEEPGKPALSEKLEFDGKSICEFSGKKTMCLSLDSTIEITAENKRVLVNGVKELDAVQVIKLIGEN